MPRLFAAMIVPPSLSLPLSFIACGLPGAKWISPENYHMTLRFMGDVDALLADQIVTRLDQISAAPMTIEVKGLGVFGAKKPHSVFANVVASEALISLQESIDRACKRLGLPADRHKFVPHITLARTKKCKASDVAHWLTQNGNFKAPPFDVERFVLMSSRDSIGGGPYRVEDYFCLYDGKAERPPAPLEHQKERASVWLNA